MNNMDRRILSLGFLFFLLLQHGEAAFDYGQALSKALLYFEAQRSGKLPSDQRVLWRGNSGLKDGSDVGLDLTGGYHDSGDHVKFGFPMAFTVTTLSWSVVEYGRQLAAKGELANTLEAIRWGTDYLIKAHPQPNVLYGEVGDGDSDHSCWMRPEEMTTPRTSFKIDASNPGSDLAGETAAAMAAASIAFKSSDGRYSATLLTHAKQLFDFARNHLGKYSDSIPVSQKFYSSSGFDDELLWAAAWLHRASGDQTYQDFLGNSGNTGGVRSMFSWDDKFFGAQILAAKLVLEGKVGGNGAWGQYKSSAEQFICNCVQKGNSNTKISPGGMLWWNPWNDLQYTTSAMLAISSYSDHLVAANANLQCAGGEVTPPELLSFVQKQVDYILGANPSSMSYMVGFGTSFPVQVHHRAASIVSFRQNSTPVGCQDGFDKWFNRNAANPNVLEGAIVGGPDANDAYGDTRSNYQQAEPATVNTAPIVGVLARLA